MISSTQTQQKLELTSPLTKFLALALPMAIGVSKATEREVSLGCIGLGKARSKRDIDSKSRPILDTC